MYEVSVVCLAHITRHLQYCAAARSTASRTAAEGIDLLACECEKIERFTASKGWVVNFAKRHTFCTVALSSETGSVDSSAVAADMSLLRETLAYNDATFIFYVNETGLFYNLLPKLTYICRYENRNSCSVRSP